MTAPDSDQYDGAGSPAPPRSRGHGHGHGHSRSLSSFAFPSSSSSSSSSSPSPPDARPFPDGEFSLDLERFRAQSERRLSSFRAADVEQRTVATSAGTLLWTETRRGRMGSASVHRGPAHVCELRFLQFDHGRTVPKYVSRLEFRQAMHDLGAHAALLHRYWAHELTDGRGQLLPPAHSPVNAHLAPDLLARLEARKDNALKLHDVMKAFAARRARDEAAYALTPLRGWGGGPGVVHAMLSGDAPPPEPGAGNDDFALHLALFLRDRGPPLLPDELVCVGIYDEGSGGSFSTVSVDERGGAPHFVWGCLTDGHLGPRRWTGFGLGEPEVLLVRRPGSVEYVVYSGGRVSNDDMGWVVVRLSGACKLAMSTFDRLGAYDEARPGELDIEKLAVATGEYARALRGMQRAILLTHRYLRRYAEARLAPPPWSPWDGDLFEDPRSDPTDQTSVMDGHALSEYAFHLVSYIHRHGVPPPPRELEEAIAKAEEWHKEKWGGL